MRHLIVFLLISIVLLGCEDSVGKPSETAESTSSEIEIPLSTAQLIANAYGFEHWKDVEELRFTFNLELPNRHLERAFIWNPKTKDVSYIHEGDSLQYNRNNALDSVQTAADQRFINDKYWLLAPFQLVWDENLSFTEQKSVEAPISKDTLHLLTAVYPSQGGYTPGDAYDFYYDDNFIIKEWVYRPGNQEAPALITTWEDLLETNNIKLAQHRKDSTQNFHLYFTNLSIR